MSSEQSALHWGLRRRRSPVNYAAMDRGLPRSYSMPCSPPQLAEKGGRSGWRAKRPRAEPPLEASADELAVGPVATSLALLVREPWVSLLCRGEKTWELRGSRTHKRGRVALVSSGTGGWVVGGATLVACHGPLTAAQLAATEALHCVPAGGTAAGRYKTVYAWEFAAAAELACPLRYDHPSGAVIWVTLPEPVEV